MVENVNYVTRGINLRRWSSFGERETVSFYCVSQYSIGTQSCITNIKIKSKAQDTGSGKKVDNREKTKLSKIQTYKARFTAARTIRGVFDLH